MGFLEVTSPFSAVNPKVSFEDGVLRARTNLFLQVLSLFSWNKRVVVDAEARTITVKRRYLWILQSETEIGFDDISHIEYRYGSLTTSFDWLGNAQDVLESFSVDLALHDGSEHRLFSFRGDGARSTGAVGVLLGDSLVDYQGDQAKRSLSYVDALQELTGKGLSKNARGRYGPGPLGRR